MFSMVNTFSNTHHKNKKSVRKNASFSIVHSNDIYDQEAISKIRSISKTLRMSKIFQKAAITIFKNATDAGFDKMFARRLLVAAAVYTASGKIGVWVSLSELSEACGVEKKLMFNTSRLMCRELGIRFIPSRPKI